MARTPNLRKRRLAFDIGGALWLDDDDEEDVDGPAWLEEVEACR